MNLSLRIFCFLSSLSGVEVRDTIHLEATSLKCEQFSLARAWKFGNKEAEKIMLTVETTPGRYLEQFYPVCIEFGAACILSVSNSGADLAEELDIFEF